MLLKIENLTATIDNKIILDNINLDIEKGTIHVIMGPNGSGKSTLGYVLAGKPEYHIDKKSCIWLNKKNILKLNPTERAAEGIFLSFQNPLEIQGINNKFFLKTAIDNIRKHQKKEKMETHIFIKKIKQYMKEINIEEKLMKRNLNEGFSGGEKKRNEILQMMMIKPQLCILDETDSGLDIDALKNLANIIKKMKNNKRSFIIITHYQKLLEYIKPDFIHILIDGKIIKTGNIEISKKIEKYGYDKIKYTKDNNV